MGCELVVQHITTLHGTQWMPREESLYSLTIHKTLTSFTLTNILSKLEQYIIIETAVHFNYFTTKLINTAYDHTCLAVDL